MNETSSLEFEIENNKNLGKKNETNNNILANSREITTLKQNLSEIESEINKCTNKLNDTKSYISYLTEDANQKNQLVNSVQKEYSCVDGMSRS